MVFIYLQQPLFFQPFPNPLMINLVFGFHFFKYILKPWFLADTVKKRHIFV
ncbi:MAG: hypothetical protein FD181_1152 [Prolixibacteraceae bacterium]|nr:MAG: hypothetical protein FD181_1152 [Prolixibacteraceae bacterium]